ncbi:uncharacterized protein LOC112569370 [Pomacea canaliculata]|uniref:uncharacterized protein LOC112569370 n=1 Tax=Pomacea canaliculata TaxID=400727 RepID=UPI000D726C60|nr:uncharacterized protein LOC112569370 [Pomacea canaliculata]
MLVTVFLGLLAVTLSHGIDPSDSLFDLVDGNKDGVVEFSEMLAAFKNDDSNKDGLMTFEEFAAGAHPGSPPLLMSAAFRFYDIRDNKPNDNFLDSGCLVALFNGLDGDKDGKITREEIEDNYLPLFLDDGGDIA